MIATISAVRRGEDMRVFRGCRRDTASSFDFLFTGTPTRVARATFHSTVFATRCQSLRQMVALDLFDLTLRYSRMASPLGFATVFPP
jgi:hypothetical protein